MAPVCSCPGTPAESSLNELFCIQFVKAQTLQLLHTLLVCLWVRVLYAAGWYCLQFAWDGGCRDCVLADRLCLTAADVAWLHQLQALCVVGGGPCRGGRTAPLGDGCLQRHEGV